MDGMPLESSPLSEGREIDIGWKYWETMIPHRSASGLSLHTSNRFSPLDERPTADAVLHRPHQGETQQPFIFAPAPFHSTSAIPPAIIRRSDPWIYLPDPHQYHLGPSIQYAAPTRTRYSLSISHQLPIHLIIYRLLRSHLLGVTLVQEPLFVRVDTPVLVRKLHLFVPFFSVEPLVERSAGLLIEGALGLEDMRYFIQLKPLYSSALLAPITHRNVWRWKRACIV